MICNDHQLIINAFVDWQGEYFNNFIVGWQLMDVAFYFSLLELHQLLDQLVLVDRDYAIHLVTQYAKVVYWNDRLALICAISLNGEAVKQVSLLVDF